jgi:hypothetical protein
MRLYGGLLHSWLRPQYLEEGFLQRAVTRWVLPPAAVRKGMQHPPPSLPPSYKRA